MSRHTLSSQSPKLPSTGETSKSQIRPPKVNSSTSRYKGEILQCIRQGNGVYEYPLGGNGMFKYEGNLST
jgi:hypothetical protein